MTGSTAGWAGRRDDLGHGLVVVAVFRNEASYLDEWLTFHGGVGVEHFVLYDDASTDAPATVLAPWIEAGRATLLAAEGREQLQVYADALERFGPDARWMAFLDIDEFLFSPSARDLRTVLSDYAEHPAVFVHWLLFGSNGHRSRPEGSVIESYTRCLGLQGAAEEVYDHGAVGAPDYVTGWARCGKSVVDPRRVRIMGAHVPRALTQGTLVDETARPAVHRGPPRGFTCDRLRINHYWSKSIEELTAKVRRGSIFRRSRPPRHVDAWLRREACLNRVEDVTILPLWRAIRAEADEKQLAVGPGRRSCGGAFERGS